MILLIIVVTTMASITFGALFIDRMLGPADENEKTSTNITISVISMLSLTAVAGLWAGLDLASMWSVWIGN